MASCQEAVTEVEMQAVGERERKGWKDLSDMVELLLFDILSYCDLWGGYWVATVFDILWVFISNNMHGRASPGADSYQNRIGSVN